MEETFFSLPSREGPSQRCERNSRSLREVVSRRELWSESAELCGQMQSSLMLSHQTLVSTKYLQLLYLGRILPYESSFKGSSARSVINAAIAEYERNTCINFVPRTTQRDYVYFIRGSG